jgi:hypothetical protein
MYLTLQPLAGYAWGRATGRDFLLGRVGGHHETPIRVAPENSGFDYGMWRAKNVSIAYCHLEPETLAPNVDLANLSLFKLVANWAEREKWCFTRTYNLRHCVSNAAVLFRCGTSTIMLNGHHAGTHSQVGAFGSAAILERNGYAGSHRNQMTIGAPYVMNQNVGTLGEVKGFLGGFSGEGGRICRPSRVAQGKEQHQALSNKNERLNNGDTDKPSGIPDDRSFFTRGIKRMRPWGLAGVILLGVGATLCCFSGRRRIGFGLLRYRGCIACSIPAANAVVYGRRLWNLE